MKGKWYTESFGSGLVGIGAALCIGVIIAICLLRSSSPAWRKWAIVAAGVTFAVAALVTGRYARGYVFELSSESQEIRIQPRWLWFIKGRTKSFTFSEIEDVHFIVGADRADLTTVRFRGGDRYDVRLGGDAERWRDMFLDAQAQGRRDSPSGD